MKVFAKYGTVYCCLVYIAAFPELRSHTCESVMLKILPHLIVKVTTTLADISSIFHFCLDLCSFS